MKKYVVAFIFTPDYKNVWLIRKNKPEWQKGHLNGIGGKIEDGESPEQAIIREIKEESGVTFDDGALINVGFMQGLNNDESAFQVDIFTGISSNEFISQEEEKISLFQLIHVKSNATIENVPMLIETCLYKLTGHSHFDHIRMIYT